MHGETYRNCIGHHCSLLHTFSCFIEIVFDIVRHDTADVAEVFDQLAASGQTIVIVTHDMQIAKRAARQITMEDGNIIRDESLSKQLIP